MFLVHKKEGEKPDERANLRQLRVFPPALYPPGAEVFFAPLWALHLPAPQKKGCRPDGLPILEIRKGGAPCFRLTKEHTDRTVRGQFGFRMNFSSISADWRRRTEFRSTDSSLSAANMRWIIWKKEKRETTKPAGAPLVFNCKIITVLYGFLVEKKVKDICFF